MCRPSGEMLLGRPLLPSKVMTGDTYLVPVSVPPNSPSRASGRFMVGIDTSAAAANCSCDHRVPCPALVGGKAAGEVEPEDLSGNLIVVLP